MVGKTCVTLFILGALLRYELRHYLGTDTIPCCHDRCCVCSETAALASTILPFKAVLLMYLVL